MSSIRTLNELNPQLFINTENFWGFFELNWNGWYKSLPEYIWLKILWVSSNWSYFLWIKENSINWKRLRDSFVVIDTKGNQIFENTSDLWAPIMHNDTVLFKIDDETVEIYDLKNWTSNFLKTWLAGEDSSPNAIWIVWKDKWLIVLIRIKADSNPSEYVKRVYWLDGQLIYEESLPNWPTEEREKTTLNLNSNSIAVRDFDWEYWLTGVTYPRPSIWRSYKKLFKIPNEILEMFPPNSICTDIGTYSWNKTNWDIFEVIFFDKNSAVNHSSVLFDSKWTPLFMNKSWEKVLITLINWWLIEQRKDSISVLTNKNIWVYDNIEYKKWWLVTINGTSYLSKYPLSHLYSWEEMKLTNCLQEVLELKETNEIVIKWKRYKKSIVLK